jgi:hypothetical protein
VTAEHRQALSASIFHTARFGYGRTRIGQNVEANTTQAVSDFGTGRSLMARSTSAASPRFGPLFGQPAASAGRVQPGTTTLNRAAAIS